MDNNCPPHAREAARQSRIRLKVLQEESSKLKKKLAETKREIEAIESIPNRYESTAAYCYAQCHNGLMLRRDEVLRGLLYQYGEYYDGAGARRTIQQTALGLGFTEEEIQQAGMDRHSWD